MIMAVSFRLTLFIAVLVPAGLLLTACGSRNQEPPREQAVTSPAQPAPPPRTTDSRPVIAAFGDSLSAGFGVDPGKSFPDDIQRMLDAVGYNYHVVNLGVSGDTTTDGVERLPNVLAVHPAIVVLEFGGNDGLRGLPVTSTQQNLATMIESLQKSGAQVMLAGMTLPRNYGPEYIHSFEQVYIDLAKKYSLVRMPFLLDGVGGHADLMQADGIHPTAVGAQIVARNVMKYLQPMLKAKPQAHPGL
jgi:acyl-CoA thioesterase-1